MEEYGKKPVIQAIQFIEDNLTRKLDLGAVAEAVHYSPYHLHRLFAGVMGMTVHDYVRRRKLTEAARQLAFSDAPILQVALTAGYESQQSFSGIFKAMYKLSPAEYRRRGTFYPLQLRWLPEWAPADLLYERKDVAFAGPEDIPQWMNLLRLAIDGYPCLDECAYLYQLQKSMEKEQALLLRDGMLVTGAMIFSPDSGGIGFLAVHPQYRKQGAAQALLSKLTEELLRGREISITTYRAGDRADPGQRRAYQHLGFTEAELLEEFGYPTQRLVLSGGFQKNSRCGLDGKESREISFRMQ